MVGDNRIGEAIDRKFLIRAVCLEHNHEYNDNHGIFFAAKDRGFLEAALPAYLDWCRIHAGPEQIKGVELLLERVRRYQEANPDLVKIPDVEEDATFITKPNREQGVES